MQRIEHHIAQRIDAFVVVVGHKRQQLYTPLRRERLLGKRGRQARNEPLRDTLVLSGEHDQYALWIVGHGSNQQAIIGRMHFKQRLRKEVKMSILGQLIVGSGFIRYRCRNHRHFVARADTWQRQQAFVVMCIRIDRFHGGAGNGEVDAWVSGRNRMAPGADLDRCQTQRGQQEAQQVHAQFRVDEDVEFIGKDAL